MGKDPAIYEEINSLYEIVLRRLREHVDAGMISAYEGSTLLEALKVVLEGLGERSQTGEEVKGIMGGKILEFSADKIYNSGRRDGEEKGREEGIVEGIAIGEAKGEASGTKKMSLLITKLLAEKKYEELEKASTDDAYRESLYAVYGIA